MPSIERNTHGRRRAEERRLTEPGLALEPNAIASHVSDALAADVAASLPQDAFPIHLERGERDARIFVTDDDERSHTVACRRGPRIGVDLARLARRSAGSLAERSRHVIEGVPIEDGARAPMSVAARGGDAAGDGLSAAERRRHHHPRGHRPFHERAHPVCTEERREREEDQNGSRQRRAKKTHDSGP